MKRTSIIYIAFLCVLVGIGIGWALSKTAQKRLVPVLVRANSSKYKFINPLLYVQTDKALYPEYKELNAKIKKYADKAKESYKATHISVYYRDLNSTAWTGVNETDTYAPGSMLKVAIFMGYLFEAQMNPNFLEKTFTYTNKKEDKQNYPPLRPLHAGVYTARTLLERMIVDSDNEATQILLDNDPHGYNDVYHAFNLPQDNGQSDFMSAKDYSVLFRALYSSSYLPPYISEQALDFLSSTTFTEGLVAGVPKETTVAHKFGERTNVDTDGKVINRELHDCGIIYYPNKPYILCVMTKGDKFSDLEHIIQDISKIVYTEMKGA